MPAIGLPVVRVTCLLGAALAFSAGCASKAPPVTAPPGAITPHPATTDAPAPPAATTPAVTPPVVTPPVVTSPVVTSQVATATTPPPSPRPPAPPPLLGPLTRDQVRGYASWKSFFDQPYVPDAATIDRLKTAAADVQVLLILGTWCPDSKREVPRFFAIMDAANIQQAALKMVGVDRTKKDADGLTEKWNVTRVPTFIFLRNGQEVGRVVERTPPGSTLEAEIARALSCIEPR